MATEKVLSQFCFNQTGVCPRVARWMKRARWERRAFHSDANLAYEPEILPVSLEILSRLPRTHSSRGSLVAALLASHLEEQVMTIHNSRPTPNRRAASDEPAHADITAREAHSRLGQLMPFHRWCATLDPTDAAKELYLFVRARLKLRAAESLSAGSTTPGVRVKRPRASKARSAAPLKGGAAEQQIG